MRLIIYLVNGEQTFDSEYSFEFEFEAVDKIGSFAILWELPVLTQFCHSFRMVNGFKLGHADKLQKISE
jgi:hypothetical protein